ncbi:MAG: BlaI/MecI/CopY family transcriptional regulator, partial [Terracidiphilus sp.]
ILEQKGYVEHRQEGRAFVYRPCVAEHEAGRSEVRHVLSRFFGNSREQLLLSLLGDNEISAEELERLKEAIRNTAPDAGPHAAGQSAAGQPAVAHPMPEEGF